MPKKSGGVCPAEDEEDDDDDDDDDELTLNGHPHAQHVRYGSNGELYVDEDEFDSDDFDSEGSDDEDDDNEDDDRLRPGRSDVVIEEIHDDKPAPEVWVLHVHDKLARASVQLKGHKQRWAEVMEYRC